MKCPEVRDKLYDLLFDLLDPAERREVEAHLAGCPGCRAARDAAAGERDLLRRWTVPPPPPGLAEAVIQHVAQPPAAVSSDTAQMLSERSVTPMKHELIEPEARWLGSRRFWSVAAAVAVLVAAGFLFQWRRIERMQAMPQEAFVYGQSEAVPGLPAVWRVYVRNGATAQPIANAAVHARLVGNGREVWAGKAATDANGFAEVAPDVPADLPEGQYKLEVDAASPAGESAVSQSVEVKRSFRVMVSTDKPLYQPGQTIHIRTLALATADLRPVAGRDIVVEARDAKGNKVFKHKAKTSAFGIASADFELADQVNTGDYAIAATMGDTVSERTVKVERYVLPKFKIELSTDKGYYAPGDTLKGDLAADYTFGKPVAKGKVAVVASEFIEKLRPFATAEGTTDAEGRFHFELKLKESFVGQELKKGDAFVTLEATVTDPADHVQKKSLDLTVTSEPLRVELFPESGTLVQGVENLLYVVTAYPDGRPAKTRVTIGATKQVAETSDLGIAKVKITPPVGSPAFTRSSEKPPEGGTPNGVSLAITAEDARGVKVEVTRELRVGDRSQTILLRTDKAVYRTGETANITLLSADRAGRAFLDVVKDRRAALTKAIDIQDGKGELALDIPPDLFGTLELHAYRIMADGNIVRDTRLVQVARADDLKIEATLDKATYRPAEKALVKFLVSRRNGDPTAAALSLAGVDEAVFALAEMRPGLERVYFALQEEILKPRYEIHAHAPISPVEAMELPAKPNPQQEEASVVLFSAAEGAAPPARQAGEPYGQRIGRVDREKREATANIADAAGLIPFALFLLATLPLFGYAVLKLFRPQPLEARPQEGVIPSLSRDLSSPEATGVGVLGSTLRALSVTWVVGFYAPVILLIVGSVGMHTHQPWLPPAVVAALAAFGFLCHWTLRLRRCEAAEALPLLRKAVFGLPVAFLLAWVSAIAVGAATDRWAGFLREDVAPLLFMAIALVALGVVGALAIAGHCAAERVSAGRCVWLGLSRPFLALLPLVLLAAAMLPSLGVGRHYRLDRLARPMAEMATGARVVAKMATMPTTATRAAAEPSNAPSTLKAPARIRRYFPETLLWRPELITDEKGRAQLEVPLADSITTWRLAMSAVSKSGELGDATKGIRVFQDFFVDIDFPAALTQHDVVSVPVAVYNYLDAPQEVRLDVEEAPWFALKDSASKSLRIGPKEVTSVYFTLEATRPGTHKLLVKAHGSAMADAVERAVRVEPDGRQVVQTVNGELSENLSREIDLPDEAIDGASDLIVKIYPGSFSQVVEGLENIFQMPNGCFEQTSSTTYPNVLVLDYLRRTKQAKPEVEMKALNYINLGCQRLVSYEVPGGGFEWFGHAPAHVVLTAYGLMEFADMAKVYDVDPAVISRTRDWLLKQQQGDGSWKPTEGGIHEGVSNAFQGAALRTTAYVAWALAESAQEKTPSNKFEGATQLDFIVENGKGSDDAYTLALCANALVAAKRPEAKGFLERLDALKTADDKLAHWTSKAQGVTYSRGNVLDIETTALAAYAFLKAGHGTGAANKALAWLVTQKDPQGTWHSTQATVAAMRALLAGTGGAGGAESDLHVTVAANGKLARELDITPETSDVYRLISLRELVRKGKNTVALETSGKGNLAYQIVATHYVPWGKEAPTPEGKELSIAVDYNTTTLKKDDLLTCRVTVRYNRAGVAKMTIVDLGLPPGFEVVPAAFESLKRDKVIERYSVTGRQVILYFSEIPGGKPVAFSYQLRAKFPVKAKTPRSVVYQYYEPKVRDVAQPVELNVL